MAEDSPSDTIEMKLPLRPEWLAVLRSAVGVIAGNLGFGYDEIVQLRVAVSELFELAMKHSARLDRGLVVAEMTIRFVTGLDRLEVLVTQPMGYMGKLRGDEDRESRALLESLMDTAEFDPKNAEVRMVKRKSS